jgi:hypothetical protein
MKIKKEYVILVTVILALSLYLILRNPDRTLYQLPKVPDISKTNISKIEISKPDTTIVLKKKDDTWQIAPEGCPANTEKVKSMLEIIRKLTVTALVSESKNYIPYNLDDNKKITVRAWTGDTVAREFEMGKAATSYQHTFVKLAGDDRIYHARGNFRGKFDQTVDKLRDQTVLSFDPKEIQEIQITKGGQVIGFAQTQAPVEVTAGEEGEGQRPASQKTEGVWKTSDGKQGDETQVNRLLSTLSNLRCEQYIDGLKKEDFANPIFRIQLKGVKEYTLSIFKKTDKDAKTYPAVSSENDHPFLLPEWQANTLIGNPADLLKKPDKPQQSE